MWVPLWVKPTIDKSAANADLVAKGARWLTDDVQHSNIAELIRNDVNSVEQVKKNSLIFFICRS